MTPPAVQAPRWGSFMERIIAAAIVFDIEGNPDAPETRVLYVGSSPPGQVMLCGFRHDAILEQLRLLLPRAKAAAYGHQGHHRQGFLSSTGRFLSRGEAYTVAVAAGQIKAGAGYVPGALFSEDLW